jgi:PadR family transcriptional regulator PadR
MDGRQAAVDGHTAALLVAEGRLGRGCSIGAVYTTLQRLESKGFVKSWTSEPTPVRGGRAMRYFALTAAGDRAIRQAQATAQRL